MSFFSGFDLSAGLQQLQQVRRLVVAGRMVGGGTHNWLVCWLLACQLKAQRAGHQTPLLYIQTITGGRPFLGTKG